MSYLLLTSNYDESAWLLDLDNPDHAKQLRAQHEAAAHGADIAPYERAFVIDPKINDGQPTRCEAVAVTDKFDEDQYADAKVTYMAEHNGQAVVVHTLGYRVDGRA